MLRSATADRAATRHRPLYARRPLLPYPRLCGHVRPRRRDPCIAMLCTPDRPNSRQNMWSKFMDVKNGYAAEVWKELFDAEGVSNQIKPPINSGVAMSAPREIWVPDSKTHVAE